MALTHHTTHASRYGRYRAIRANFRTLQAQIKKATSKVAFDMELNGIEPLTS
jgi:hypothetical protein